MHSWTDLFGIMDGMDGMDGMAFGVGATRRVALGSLVRPDQVGKRRQTGGEK